MGAQAQGVLLQIESSFLKPNISKQANGAVHVVFDYNAATPPSSLPESQPTRTTTIIAPATETTVDKEPHPAPYTPSDPSSMPRNGASKIPFLSLVEQEGRNDAQAPPPVVEEEPALTWDWDIEHEDRRRERKLDAAMRDAAPFEVDRRLLKDVVREKMGREVGRIKFLSAGTFHKAYLVTLVDREDLVARVARRFMPRLKTESEVATVSYLREKTTVPVPRIYHYDSNPYNRLGGEFILMSKASGIPLSQVYHGLSYSDLVKLVKNLATIVVQLFAHRFTDIGSLYFGPNPRMQLSSSSALQSGTPTPKAAALTHYSGFPFSPTLGPLTRSPSLQTVHTVMHDYHVGPIISWPFFGSNRGELVHPTELDRGPWSTFGSYFDSCVEREISGVKRENAGSAAPHRLHLDPDEILSSRHHKLRAVPGDESDESDEYDLEESEEEGEGPGSAMYRDYRRNQRSTFLVAHLTQREQAVKREMGRWKSLMQRLVEQVEVSKEEFGLDCHDLSLENVFVDAQDHTKITCVIDWESTTTRPLWACAHVPAALQSSPFVSKLFRNAVASLPSDPSFRIPKTPGRPTVDPTQLCREWLYHEATGARLRMAHRCAEWDGWEEGLVDSILGPEELEQEWFRGGVGSYDHEALKAMIASPKGGAVGGYHDDDDEEEEEDGHRGKARRAMAVNGGSRRNGTTAGVGSGRRANGTSSSSSLAVGKVGAAQMSTKLPFIAEETQKERLLNKTGDICGGRGGELGRRLEAWLTVTGGNSDEAHEEHEEHEDEDALQDLDGEGHQGQESGPAVYSERSGVEGSRGAVPLGIGTIGR